MTLELDITLTLPGFTLRVAQSLPVQGITAVFGRSGSGKSTLLRCIAGLARPAGRIALGDSIWLDGPRFTPPHLRGVGYVFQDTRLFGHLDVAGNLDYADRRSRRHPGPTRDEVIDALDLSPLLHRRTPSLSGGEASRVAMGRALLSRPALLLMDEPLAALDAPRKDEVLPYLERLRDRLATPILYVSHSAAEVARLATHLLLIDAGSVTRSGPLADLLADPATAPAFGRDNTASLLTARVAGPEADGLTRLDTAAGPILLPRVKAPAGTSLRLRILAQDIVLALHRPEGLSALNILPATIRAMEPGDSADLLVQLALGDEPILARITRRSARALALAPGQPCFAILKSVAIAQSSAPEA